MCSDNDVNLQFIFCSVSKHATNDVMRLVAGRDLVSQGLFQFLTVRIGGGIARSTTLTRLYCTVSGTFKSTLRTEEFYTRCVQMCDLRFSQSRFLMELRFIC